jgi:predicted CoA-binding protein
MHQAIESFLAERRIAVVGVSRTRGFGNTALRALQAGGWDAVPVNSAADEVEGTRCFRRLEEVSPPPGAVLVVTPPARAVEVLEDCARLGLAKVWLQQGAESEAALRLGAERGLSLVHHACVLMYAAPRGLHRFHRWLHHLGGDRRA